MFESELRNIIRIVEKVVGSPRRTISDGDEWVEYCCPECAAEKGVDSDEKYNLCVNYNEGWFHCWACGYSGKISQLLKKYGNRKLVDRYYDELRNIKNSKEYQFATKSMIVEKELVEYENALKLPDNFSPITRSDPNSYPAYKYLKQRGIDYDLIHEYGIGYVPWSDNYKMRSRIVIPSYDQYHSLNYYVTRDYTGKQKLKYINPDVDKKKIIFNEGRVNWSGDVYLVEGPMDSLVVPNSIPLLGKQLDEECLVYKTIQEKARAKIIILLDDDAIQDARKMYSFLDKGRFKDNIRIIECPQGYDASLIYEKWGKKGILDLLRSAKKLSEFDLTWI